MDDGKRWRKILSTTDIVLNVYQKRDEDIDTHNTKI